MSEFTDLKKDKRNERATMIQNSAMRFNARASKRARPWSDLLGIAINEATFFLSLAVALIKLLRFFFSLLQKKNGDLKMLNFKIFRCTALELKTGKIALCSTLMVNRSYNNGV